MHKIGTWWAQKQKKIKNKCIRCFGRYSISQLLQKLHDEVLMKQNDLNNDTTPTEMSPHDHNKAERSHLVRGRAARKKGGKNVFFSPAHKPKPMHCLFFSLIFMKEGVSGFHLCPANKNIMLV